MKKDYHKNVELALNFGFEEARNEKAYRGKCYKKDGLGWIHDIEALKTSLNIDEDEKLRHKGYDVGSYYYYVGYRNEMVGKKLALELIKARIHSDSSVLSGKFSWLRDEGILEGMVSLFAEGCGEETLYDYAIQMSKK